MRKIAYLLLLACGTTLQSEAQSTDSPEKQPEASSSGESNIPKGYTKRVSLFNGKDIDNDGDLDIAATTRQNGCYLLRNQLTPSKESTTTTRTDLFNGKDLTGWSVKCAEQDKDKTF